MMNIQFTSEKLNGVLVQKLSAYYKTKGKREHKVIYKMYIQPLEILRHHFEIMKVVSYFPPRLYVY